MGLGYIIYLYRPASAFILMGILAFALFYIILKENKNNEALMAAAYISGAEVFFRMTDGMFFYETGKYAVILFLFIGLFYKGSSVKSISYWVYLLILAPGIVVASVTVSYDIDFRNAIAFNLSGPVCLGVAAVYCYYKKITKTDFQLVLLMLLLPLISQMFYLYFYTPSLTEMNINVGANYAATAGYGPNQISTVFGFGAFLLCTRLFTIKNKFINLIDLTLLGLMGYRALVTFSRGGVYTAIACMLAFLIFFYYKQGTKEHAKINFKVVLLGISMFLIWMFSLVQSGGLLNNRYSNMDAAGNLKGDITTGRVELVVTELQAFFHHPFVGIGVGKGMEYREENMGVSIATHNEVSRLLSEHGFLGIIAILILIFVPILFWTKFKNNYYFLAFMAFWFLTINHSAMRIALPAFVYGLALLYIVDEKKKDSLYR